MQYQESRSWMWKLASLFSAELIYLWVVASQSHELQPNQKQIGEDANDLGVQQQTSWATTPTTTAPSSAPSGSQQTSGGNNITGAHYRLTEEGHHLDLEALCATVHAKANLNC
ncbi:MAG: hypothetical protein FRX49_06923 [Trebouxia sp. A1-2]|nr:MAG: hypothetical protein FRX49_06923 [Trebouxia sp. A1-2]